MEHYFSFENIHDYEFYYSIRVKDRSHTALFKIVWTGYSFDQFTRWRWYFDYRAALEKVKNPRYHVEASFGRYVKEVEDLEKNRKNKIRACKAKITEMENKIGRALEKGKSELFDIEEHPHMIAFRKKLEQKKADLIKYQAWDLEEFRKTNNYKTKSEELAESGDKT